MKKAILINLAILLGLVVLLFFRPKTAESLFVREVYVEKYTALEVVDVVKPNVKDYAKQRVVEVWGDSQWTYFNQIVIKESHWKSTAQNPNSSAYGIMQFLNGTWKTVGCVKTSDPYIQVDCGIKYIKQKYGNPQKAVVFHNSKGYY